MRITIQAKQIACEHRSGHDTYLEVFATSSHNPTADLTANNVKIALDEAFQNGLLNTDNGTKIWVDSDGALCADNVYMPFLQLLVLVRPVLRDLENWTMNLKTGVCSFHQSFRASEYQEP